MRISDWSSDVCSSDLDLARRHGRLVPVRLVKGAYWDTEIKRAQADGVEGYPVFTRKPNTDVSYQACARRLLDATDAVYPMFATHTAQTIAAVPPMARAANGGARGPDGRVRSGVPDDRTRGV